MTAPAGLIDCARLREDVDTAAVALAQWAYRDTTKVPGVRDCANVAIECIDSALRELHRIRAELVGQIRVYDDATAARTDALLAQIRAERSPSNQHTAKSGATKPDPTKSHHSPQSRDRAEREQPPGGES